MSGMMAPPMMPVTSIPEKLPWCSATELSAREKITGHITAAKKPTTGNAMRATGPDRNRAAVKLRIAATVKHTSTILLSSTFSSTIPARPPTVMSPQNQATALAPVVCGS